MELARVKFEKYFSHKVGKTWKRGGTRLMRILENLVALLSRCPSLCTHFHLFINNEAYLKLKNAASFLLSTVTLLSLVY